MPFRSSQTPSNSTVYARSPVKSGFQRSLRKARTILPVAVQNSPTLLPVSFYWSFYWRSLPGFVEISPGQKHYPLPNDAVPDNRIVLVECRTRKNSISWTQSSRICVPGNDFPHYPATVLQLSLHPRLLAILLAIAGGRTACWRPACTGRSVTTNSTRRLVSRQIANRASIEGFDLIESKAPELSSSPGSI